MGREVRRVPLDFSLPIGERWPGFMLDNYLPKCSAFDGDGYTKYPDKCIICDGHGNIATAEQRAILEVPTGEGWQVWETVSEGSPITPVFPTAEALIDHLVAEVTHDVGNPWHKQVQWDQPFRRAAAEAFVKQGWAPSLFVNRSSSGTDVFYGASDADKIRTFSKGDTA